MNLDEKKFGKKLTGSRFFKAIFYNVSLWENGFLANIFLAIKPISIKTKYINTIRQDLSNDIPHDI